MTSEAERPTGRGDEGSDVPPPPPDVPTDDAGLRSDDSILDDVPDTTTGKQQLIQNDEGRPGPGV